MFNKSIFINKSFWIFLLFFLNNFYVELASGENCFERYCKNICKNREVGVTTCLKSGVHLGGSKGAICIMVLEKLGLYRETEKREFSFHEAVNYCCNYEKDQGLTVEGQFMIDDKSCLCVSELGDNFNLVDIRKCLRFKKCTDDYNNTKEFCECIREKGDEKFCREEEERNKKEINDEKFRQCVDNIEKITRNLNKKKAAETYCRCMGEVDYNYEDGMKEKKCNYLGCLEQYKNKEFCECLSEGIPHYICYGRNKYRDKNDPNGFYFCYEINKRPEYYCECLDKAKTQEDKKYCECLKEYNNDKKFCEKLRESDYDKEIANCYKRYGKNYCDCLYIKKEEEGYCKCIYIDEEDKDKCECLKENNYDKKKCEFYYGEKYYGKVESSNNESSKDSSKCHFMTIEVIGGIRNFEEHQVEYAKGTLVMSKGLENKYKAIKIEVDKLDSKVYICPKYDTPVEKCTKLIEVGEGHNYDSAIIAKDLLLYSRFINNFSRKGDYERTKGKVKITCERWRK